jgi:hypothetical protein
MLAIEQVIEQAAVVPAIIVVTQVLKPFKKYYKAHGLVALAVAVLGTLGVGLINMGETAFYGMNSYAVITFVIGSMFTAVTTWLSAAKIYDMSLGKKKAKKKVQEMLEEEFMKGVDVGKNGDSSAE